MLNRHALRTADRPGGAADLETEFDHRVGSWQQLGSAEREVLQVAEEMPADRYNFAPTSGEFKGVRTFAQKVKHIAADGCDICSTIK